VVLNTLATSFLSFTIFLFLHIVIWRMIDGYRGIILILITSIISYILTNYILEAYLLGSLTPEIWMTAPLFYCLIMLYSHFYVGVLKSVSIRIIEELYRAENLSMSRDQIDEIYSSEEMILSRLLLLENKEWIIKENGKYKCLNKAIFTVRINLFLHKIYRLNNTG
jgi:hypothetical protein